MKSKRVGVLAGLISALCWSSIAEADEIKRILNWNHFGHLNNDGNRCAATATMNAFQFLEKTYPKMYVKDNKKLLTKGDLKASRDQLANGWTHGTKTRGGMGNPAPGRDFWNHKLYWIEDYAPKTSVFGGMVSGTAGTGFPAKWHHGNLLTRRPVTWDFLWEEINHEKAIELTIGSERADMEHVITLRGLWLNDINKNGHWNPPEESAKLWYIDPDSPNADLSAELQRGTGTIKSFIVFKRGKEDWYIGTAYTEGPIPEPGSLLLLLVGGAAALRRRTTLTTR